MKVIFLTLTGLMIMLVGAYGADSDIEEQITALSEYPGAATTIEDITGQWYGFPAGLLLQFSDDGSAHFGLDWNGTAIGYEARIWFTGQGLSIQFANYDGQIKPCYSAVGLYNVHLLEDDTIRFVPVYDDCQFRMDILAGSADAGYGLIYHREQD